MPNSIFIAAQSDISARMNRNRALMHVFGGLCVGQGPREAIQTGIDFGGGNKRDFSTRGSLASADARQLLILPISQRSSDLFRDYTEKFKALYRSRPRLLPFYFSEKREVIPYQEVEGELPVDLYGELMAVDDEEVYDYQRLYKEDGREKRRKHPEGLVRSRAACAVFFNFAAELSGIDMARVHPDWMKVQDGDQYSACLRGVFDDADQNKTLPRGIDLRMLKGEIGMVLRIQDHCAEIPMNEIITAVSEHMGGFDKLSAYFNSCEAFETRPLPKPWYIADAIKMLSPENT